MSVLVSIDPGLSTGVAVFVNGTFAYSFTSQPPHDDLRRTLVGLRSNDDVVCEKGPSIRRQAETCAPVEALVTELVDNVQWVRPTAWKPDPKAEVQPGDSPGNKHERDAIRLGRYWLNHRERFSGDTEAA